MTNARRLLLHGVMTVATAASAATPGTGRTSRIPSIDLGTLPGDVSSFALVVNGLGQVAGHSISPSGVSRAFFWDRGAMVEIAPFLDVKGLNDRGEVIGWMADFGAGQTYHSFLWKDGTMTDLGSLDGKDTFAAAINDVGEVVGRSGDHAFLWRDGTMIDLGPGAADLINDAGQVVINGFGGPGPTYRAALWQDGTITDLESLGGPFTSAYAMNGLGHVVGFSYEREGGPVHAILWRDGRLEDLGTLGGSAATGLAINDLDQVVIGKQASWWHLWLWQNGSLTDLGADAETGDFPSINARGDVTFESMSTYLHGFAWQSGIATDLGFGGVRDLNDRGVAVGYRFAGSTIVACLWAIDARVPGSSSISSTRIGTALGR